MSDGKSPIAKLFGSRKLKGISDIRTFFRTNEQPIFFVGPTAFNLLGIDRWVRNFRYIVYYDSWDAGHPRVFTPAEQAVRRIRKQRGDQQLPAARSRSAGAHGIAGRPSGLRRWSRWCSSTRRPRRSAGSSATT